MIHFQHKSLENIIIHRKLHYAGHTKIVKIKSNRSSVSLIHAQTCVQSTSSLLLFRPYYSLFFIIFSRVHFLLFCACACVVCFNNVFNIFWENERQQEQKEQNLLVFTSYASFHKYERIDLVAPFFQKLSINIIFKLSNFNRRVMSYIPSDKRENDVLNKAIVICKTYMM